MNYVAEKIEKLGIPVSATLDFISIFRHKERPSQDGFGKGEQVGLFQPHFCRRELAPQFLAQRAWRR